MGAHRASANNSGIVSESAPMFGTYSAKEEKGAEPVLAVADRLLTELKKAYSQILHEKEEQILHLKEEVLDLKTLARVLESENDRLNGQKRS